MLTSRGACPPSPVTPLLCAAALLGAAMGYSPPADALVTIRAEQSVGRPRRDAGQGICATTVHVKDPGMGVAAFPAIDRAVTALGQQVGQGSVDGRQTGVYPLINFRNSDPGAIGDFPGPGTSKSYFPFSDDVNAVPRGNDRNFALRARGYLSVLRAGTVTVAVSADDFHKLSIAGTAITQSDERISARVAAQVKFDAAGFYPVEVVYAQNASIAVLEISQADGAQAEGNLPRIDTSLYSLVPTSRLYTAREGKSSCAECAGPGACPEGNSCADGLCQPCVSAQNCGPTCMKCPDRQPVCGNGACVECTADYHCPPGKVCDTARSTCIAGVPCRVNADCPPGKTCDPESGVCTTPPAPCTSDVDCPTDQICNIGKAICIPSPVSCKVDGDCPSTQVCDLDRGECKWPLRGRYVGGSGCSAAGGAGPGGLGVLFALGLIALLLRRSRRAWAGVAPSARGLGRAALVLTGVFFCMTEGRAEAQLSANAQTFRPAIGPRNIVTVEGTNTPGRLRPIFGGVLEFAYRPLRLVDPETGQSLADTVGSMTTLHVLGGLGLTDWLHLGAALPIVLYQSFDARTPPMDAPLPPSAFGVGDLRLLAKMRIIDNTEKGFGLAFVPQISFPVGKGQEFRGDDAFDIEPRAAADYRFGNGAFIAVNLGFLLRTSEQVVRDMLVTHQIRYGLGAYVPLYRDFGLGGELVGGTSLGRKDAGPVYSPLDANLVARWQHRSGLQVDAGGGWGFTSAVGSPQFRLFAAVAYVPMAKVKRAPRNDDPDGDGLVGEADRCPLQAGPVENQGCPDKDTDKDGLVDRVDACPTEPGPAANRGCPDKDTDGDGISDRFDKCPTQPGVPPDGCPELDTDKDGVADRLDKCPFDPGPKPDGCPERKYIAVTQDKIELKQKVYFATAKSEIKPQSFGLLDEIVDVLRKRDSMELLIEGHTDSRGGHDYNMRLSEARARSVRDYLVKAGIDPGRLTAKGYGPDRPVADNKTAVGREQNRRTEFLVIKQ